MARKSKVPMPEFDFETPSEKHRNKILLTVLLVAVAAFGVYYANSLTGFIVENPVKFKFVPTVTSYFGSEPIIDGVIGSTEWKDAGVSSSSYEGGPIRIYSKHDKQSLFLLLQWRDENPSWNYGPRLYFEQDGYTHDGNLDGKNDYSFYIPFEGCTYRGDSASYSGYYDKWVEYAGSDATTACGYSAADKLWSIEIKKPLTNTDIKLLALQLTDTKKPYNLGFAIVNYQNKVPGGIAGSSWQWPYDQASSGALSGSYTVPGDTSTWGALNIVWTRKPTAAK